MNYDELIIKQEFVLKNKNKDVIKLTHILNDILNNIAANYDDDRVIQAVDDIHEAFLDKLESEV